MMCEAKSLPLTTENIEICSISFNLNDRIRLIGVPVNETNSIRTTIQSSWGVILKESDVYTSYEFKLKGNPWAPECEEVIMCRRLLTAILKTMANFGWNLLQAADLSIAENGKDCLFFEKGMSDSDAKLFAISLAQYDKIRIIDAPFIDVCIEDAVRSEWPQGIQRKKDCFGSIEYKLAGDPWCAAGPEIIDCRRLLCKILANIRAKGYKLYASVDICSRRGMDSWVFRRVNSNWQ